LGSGGRHRHSTDPGAGLLHDPVELKRVCLGPKAEVDIVRLEGVEIDAKWKSPTFDINTILGAFNISRNIRRTNICCVVIESRGLGEKGVQSNVPNNEVGIGEYGGFKLLGFRNRGRNS